MASPARPASISGPFGSAADVAIFSTATTTRRVDPGRASETAARSSMARTRSGPRRPNQVRLLPQLSRFTGDLPRMATTSDPFSLICSGGRLSHHRRCMLNAEIRAPTPSSSRRIHPSYTPATAPSPCSSCRHRVPRQICRPRQRQTKAGPPPLQAQSPLPLRSSTDPAALVQGILVCNTSSIR